MTGIHGQTPMLLDISVYPVLFLIFGLKTFCYTLVRRAFHQGKAVSYNLYFSFGTKEKQNETKRKDKNVLTRG